MEDIKTNNLTIGYLFGQYERRQVRLPSFQRSYSWEKSHVNQFWEDLIQFEKEYSKAPTTASYFLGTIVIIEKADHILLLDGQQRFATATIILAAMRDAARAADQNGMKKGGDLARDIQRELIEKEDGAVKYALTLSELDEKFFLNAIKKDPAIQTNIKLRSHKLISTSYEIAQKRIDQLLIDKTYTEKLDKLKSFKNALAKGMSLIAMVVQNEGDAYSIFETLNDRGLRLSVPDLVLNLLMKLSPDDTARKLVRQYWDTMLHQMGKRDISRFLRHMWVSKYGDLKSEGLYSAINKYLLESEKAAIDFAEVCADECEAYVALLDADISIPNISDDLEGIVKYLRIASAPPLLLSGYKCLNSSEFIKLVSNILSTYIRFVLITNQNPLELESVFYEASRTIRSLDEQGQNGSSQFDRHLKKWTMSKEVSDEETRKISKGIQG